MTTKLSDLRVAWVEHGVIDSGTGEPFGSVFGYREVTVADLVAALIAEGGATVWWCGVHRKTRAQGLKFECEWGAAARNSGFDDYEDCRMVQAVVFPIPVESAEAKET